MSRCYSVALTGPAAKQVRKLQPPDRRRVLAAIASLEDEPRPPGVRKLVGEENAWRIRTGDFRVIYEIDDGLVSVLVVRVGHRRDVYEN